MEKHLYLAKSSSLLQNFAPAVGILPGPCATKYALIVFSLA